MSEPFNQLTPTEVERLALLAEECAEVIQVIGKILRHGYESRHPDGGPTNRDQLHTEIAHVIVATDLMYEAEDLLRDFVSNKETEKWMRVGCYLHHQVSPAPAAKPKTRVCEACGETKESGTMDCNADKCPLLTFLCPF